MSEDGDVKKSGGYKFDYANSARAQCKGPKPCKGSKLEKGVLRLGVVTDFRGHPSWSYRHYGCTTKKVFQNMKKSFASAEEIEGFGELTEADQEKVRVAWEKEEVAAEDIPATAIAGAEEEEDSPKKKAGRPRKKAKLDDDDGSDAPKPKKKAAPRRKKKADSDEDAEISGSEDDAGGSDYGAGKKRKRGGGAKKSPRKKRAVSDDD